MVSVSRYAVTLCEFEYPEETYSPNHKKMNPMTKGGKIAKDKLIAKIRGNACGMTKPRIHQLCDGYAITLTRISRGKLDDDNLGGALKPVRDGVADALGLKSDRTGDKLHIKCEQEYGPVGYYGVKVKIEGVR